jgi:uncharacterized protein YoaH (UPF0181 family)
MDALKQMMVKGIVSDEDVRLVEDFAASGEAAAHLVAQALREAETKRDINERRKVVGRLLARAKKVKAFL